jgi:hypothetical protein
LYGWSFSAVANLWHPNFWLERILRINIAKILTMNRKSKKSNQAEELKKSIDKLLERKKNEKQAFLKLLSNIENKIGITINKNQSN